MSVGQDLDSVIKNRVLSLDRVLAENYCKNNDFEKGLKLYSNLIEDSCNEDDIKKFVDYSIKYSAKFFRNKDWAGVLEIYKDILKFKNIPDVVYKNAGLCLTSMGYHKEAIDFLKVYRSKVPNDPQIYQIIGEIYYSNLGNYLEAIGYYERALSLGGGDFTTYNTLGHLYSKVYRDSKKEEQISYFEKAYSIQPESEIVVKNLAYVYGKFDEVEKADKMWNKMLTLNPSYSDLHSWGAYLVKHGRFQEGFLQLRNRFKKEDIPGEAFASIIKHKDKMWKLEDSLFDKRVLVHCEQGFGDSIMFVRFVKQLIGRCRSLKVAVPNSLLDLFRESNPQISFVSKDDVDKIEFDSLIPMMDLPLLCGTSKDTIPYATGYLSVPENKVTEYKEKYIDNNGKFKIGFAFEGSGASVETKRDIPVTFFYRLMRMNNIDMYCFQVDDLFNQLNKVPGDCEFKRLGSTFKNWQDTACAIKNMDLMISSDNGVMNLAGALGAKTFGIFNSMSEWRWIDTKGENVKWYASVKPFACDTTDNWDFAMRNAIEEVKNLAF